MLWTNTAEEDFLLTNGGVMLAESTTFPGLTKVVEAQGYLCVPLGAPGPAQRGKLSSLIEEAIDISLDNLGAVAPGVGASVNVDASISDQLYRARLIERRGIVVLLPTLEGIANLEGILDADDSVALRWWMQATQERPLGLVIESGNSGLRVYPEPVAFNTLLRSSSYPPPPPTAPDQAASSEAMDLSEPPPGVIVPDRHRAATAFADQALSRLADPEEVADEHGDVQAAGGAAPPTTAEPAAALVSPAKAASDVCSDTEVPRDTEAPAEVTTRDDETLSLDEHQETTDASRALQDSLPGDTAKAGPPEAEAAGPVEACPSESGGAESVEHDHSGAQVPSAGHATLSLHDAQTVRLEPNPEILAAVRSASPPSTTPSSATGGQNPTEGGAADEPEAEPTVDDTESAASSVEDTDEPPASGPRSARRPEAEPSDPFHRLAQREWPNWMRELNSTRGPKPLAVVERTFVSAYTPLREAWIRGIAGPQATPALKTFADSFEHSYAEAFDALRVRGKRPTMVLDIPEIAQRIGRLHGARAIQLLLVDAMRFDVGLRIQDRVRKRAQGEVSLAERLLLWSGLPTTTETQLDLIAKGPAGLKEPIVPSDTPVVVARGKNAATPRRIKAGHKELIKLDVIEANLSQPGKREATRLDEMADAVATASVDYFHQLPPRTLVMMFGDHGFLCDPLDGGSSAGRSGGASPEEVLVPAFAWLIGSVH